MLLGVPRSAGRAPCKQCPTRCRPKEEPNRNWWNQQQKRNGARIVEMVEEPLLEHGYGRVAAIRPPQGNNVAHTMAWNHSAGRQHITRPMKLAKPPSQAGKGNNFSQGKDSEVIKKKQEIGAASSPNLLFTNSLPLPTATI